MFSTSQLLINRWCLFTDDLANDILLGESYELVCRAALYPKYPSHMLSVCSVPRIHQSRSLVIAKQMGSYTAPPAIAAAQSALRNTPGALVMLLATHVGRHDLPPNTFTHLRLAALLSLASQVSYS